MKVLVLGSAAGSGYRRPAASNGATRTRSAIAVSADGRDWALINASPDIGEQLRQHEALNAPNSNGNASPIRAVVLTSAEIDAAAGLLSLRDGPPLDLYATPSVFEDLTSGLPLLTVLEHYCGVRWHLLGVAGDQNVFAFQIDGLGSLVFEALALPGGAPPYSSHHNDPSPGDRIALRVFDPATRRRLIYAPGLARGPHAAFDRLHDADCLLLDGSAWGHDEQAPAAAGAAPSLPELLAQSRAQRKVLLHLRAGDPLLDDDSPQRQGLQSRGIEIGYDGMEIML